MNFGVIVKKYAYQHGLAEDLTEERLLPFMEGAQRMTEARMTKASGRFDQLREMTQKRWKLVEVPAKKKKKK